MYTFDVSSQRCSLTDLHNNTTLILDFSVVDYSCNKSKEWEMRPGPPASLNSSSSMPNAKSSWFLCVHSFPPLRYGKFHSKKEMMPGHRVLTTSTKPCWKVRWFFPHLMLTLIIEVNTVVLPTLRITSLKFNKWRKLHLEQTNGMWKADALSKSISFSLTLMTRLWRKRIFFYFFPTVT